MHLQHFFYLRTFTILSDIKTGGKVSAKRGVCTLTLRELQFPTPMVDFAISKLTSMIYVVDEIDIYK
jgi:hypothetical protein